MFHGRIINISKNSTDCNENTKKSNTQQIEVEVDKK